MDLFAGLGAIGDMSKMAAEASDAIKRLDARMAAMEAGQARCNALLSEVVELLKKQLVTLDALERNR